jgi:hypothetical protein
MLPFVPAFANIFTGFAYILLDLFRPALQFV